MSQDLAFDNSAAGGNHDTIHDEENQFMENKHLFADEGILEMQVLTDRTERDVKRMNTFKRRSAQDS